MYFNCLLTLKRSLEGLCNRLSVCPSVRHASTTACTKPYMSKGNKESPPERFAGSYDITLYIEYFEARLTCKFYFLTDKPMF